ncbi:MAG: enoyl-CoA hydratase/isomerase family protein [Chloroflexi bacterium]|nr:enoyl-CoA hydratase/isomerase family protein [Chloroflexota bacterium]
MADYSTIIVERDSELAGLTTITLNRPEKLNALSVQLHDDLQDACMRLQDDYETRVVILTGAGRAFSSGAQLGDRRESTPVNDVDRRARASIGGKTSAMLESLEQVTIGAVNGLAIGGAVVFLTCLDMRIAADAAWFSIPEVELNLPLTWQAIPRLMRELGPARTKELVMACERFTAQQALEWGFVNHVHPKDQVMPESRKLAARLLSMDPLSLAMTKTACNAAANMMVPVEVAWSDRELMLLAYRQGALRASKGTGPQSSP